MGSNTTTNVNNGGGDGGDISNNTNKNTSGGGGGGGGGGVLSSKLSIGPVGYGDPSDRTLRKVEKEVMIPKLIRERSKMDKCSREKHQFDQCCLDAGGINMIWRCREVNEQYKQCMAKWFRDKDFIQQCTEEYLAKRAEFRETGVKDRKKFVTKSELNR